MSFEISKNVYLREQNIKQIPNRSMKSMSVGYCLSKKNLLWQQRTSSSLYIQYLCIEFQIDMAYNECGQTIAAISVSRLALK